MSQIPAHPLELVRTSCARFAARARRVEIDPDRLDAYARELAGEPIAGAPASAPFEKLAGTREERCRFVLMLDAVNFGSGYFPHLVKRAGKSGYRTIEGHLLDLFARGRAPAAAELAQIDAGRCTEIFGQQAAPRDPIGELMELFARAWRDLGGLTLDRFGGSFAAIVDDARGEAENLVRTLLEMPLYRDVAEHSGEPVWFLKRAQITVADLQAALDDAPFADLRPLTLFADNLIPHVLRLDGVLVFATDLVEHIESETPIAAGSVDEVEIRACAVHAVEGIAARMRALGRPIWPHQLDAWLWVRGGERRYKLRPRHRSRCAFY